MSVKSLSIAKDHDKTQCLSIDSARAASAPHTDGRREGEREREREREREKAREGEDFITSLKVF